MVWSVVVCASCPFSADDRLKEQRNALVVTYSTGDLLWMPQAILRSSCSFDTKFFPFDEQECILKFSSWSYNGFKLDIHFLPNKTAFDLDVSIWFICLNIFQFLGLQI